MTLFSGFFKKILFFTVCLILFGELELKSENKKVIQEQSMHDLMAWVIEPAADNIWDSSGSVVTLEGEISLTPITREDWEALKNSAMVIAESGQMLSLSKRALDEYGWKTMSELLTKNGLETFQAAEEQDSIRLFRLGAELYQVCLSCHEAYWLKTVEID